LTVGRIVNRKTKNINFILSTIGRADIAPNIPTALSGAVIGNAMETSHFKRNYILKVWGLTILCAPIFIMLLTKIIMANQGNKLDSGAFGFIAFSFGYGLVFSIPTFLIIYFLFSQFSKRIHSAFLLKLSLIGIGIVCLLCTFYLLYGNEAYELNGNYAALTFSIAYTFCLTFFGLILSVKS
jgi:hypothetical protein